MPDGPEPSDALAATMPVSITPAAAAGATGPTGAAGGGAALIGNARTPRSGASPGCAPPEALAVAAALKAGHRLGHFEIIRLLGKGGMGAVYLARDLSLERDVAL